MRRDEIFAELADGCSHVQLTYGGKSPAKLLMSNAVYCELLRDAHGRYGRFTEPWQYDVTIGAMLIPRIFGMLAALDEYTPVWRMLSEHDDLLHDPREGKTLREVLADARR